MKFDFISTPKKEYIENNTFVIRDTNRNLKRFEDLKYLGSYITSAERDVEIRIGKAWGALNQLNNKTFGNPIFQTVSVRKNFGSREALFRE